MMRTINVFIASSAELKRERMELVDLLLDINQEEKKTQGWKYEPVLWEYMDASMNAQRKEDEYLAELRKCEVCIVLFGKTLGEYTKEELDVAAAEMQEGRKPYHVHVFFKEAGEPVSKELAVLKECFPKYYPLVPTHTYNAPKELRLQVSELLKNIPHETSQTIF